MKVGTLNYATDQGLGIQTRAFIDHGIIHKILFQVHSTYENHYDWYTDEQICKTEEELLNNCDVLIFMETLFHSWKLIPRARERGIKTILITHYECTPNLPYFPDLVIVPSEEDKLHFPDGVRINIPVQNDVVKRWKLRTKAEVFVHNAGHGGLGGRNGTKELLEAMKYVKSPIKLIVRHQNGGLKSDDPRVTIVNGSVPYETLWSEGDVFIIPEKFGGSFLPMQEAFASGMPVMATDRPNNHWLPKELLIPSAGIKKERIAREFDSHIISPQEIAKSIDTWYGRDITKFSLAGKEWGEQNSWDALKPKYQEIINSLKAI